MVDLGVRSVYSVASAAVFTGVVRHDGGGRFTDTPAVSHGRCARALHINEEAV